LVQRLGSISELKALENDGRVGLALRVRPGAR